MEESQRKDKRKTAKKIIKLAKKHPTWYTKEDVKYAKYIRKSLKKNDTSETSDSHPQSGGDDRIHSEGKQSKESGQSKRSWFAKVLHKASTLVGL
tara:strand:- start:1103 stop:1387 length:285 start_codon:yes stop_codon:yes gene_type:complete